MGIVLKVMGGDAHSFLWGFLITRRRVPAEIGCERKRRVDATVRRPSPRLCATSRRGSHRLTVVVPERSQSDRATFEI